MAAQDIEVVEISLLSGRSDRPSMTFTPGTPSPTVSLGSAGQWAIAGEGVGPVHVFVTFDGQSVHVAAAVPNLPTMLAGSAIGTGWTKAAIPCELRFGGACVILRRTSRPGAFTQEEATVHDGGALFQAAQRAAAKAAPHAQTAAQIPSVRPAAGMPFNRTQMSAAPPEHDAPAPAATHPPAPMDLTATVPLADAQKFRDAALAAANAARPPAELAPETVRQPPLVPADPLGEMEKTLAAPLRAPVPTSDVTAGLAGQQPPPPVAMNPSAMMGGAPPLDVQSSKPLNFWQAASPVKKATLALMPFALIMAFVMLRDDPAPPPRVAGPSKHLVNDGGALAATSAGDAGVASAAGDAAVMATTAAPTASAVDAAVAANSGSKQDAKDAKPDQAGGKVVVLTGANRTPERAALDAVAAGSFDDAAKRYDALASAHAEDPSYKEAARILREKAGN